MAHFQHSVTWVGVTGHGSPTSGVRCDPNPINQAHDYAYNSCNLKITKTFEFNTNERYVTTHVTLQNLGDETLEDVYYSRSVRFYFFFFPIQIIT